MASAFIHDVTDFLSSSAKVRMYVYDLFIYCTVISVHAPTLHVSYTKYQSTMSKCMIYSFIVLLIISVHLHNMCPIHCVVVKTVGGWGGGGISVLAEPIQNKQ